MPTSPEAGWYADQRDPELLRYWDGTTWTGDTMAAPPPDGEHTLPISMGSPASSGPPGPARPTVRHDVPPATARLAAVGTDAPWHTRWWVVGGAALVVGLLVGAAVTGGRDLKDAAGPVDRPSATMTVTASPSPSPTPSPPSSPTPGASPYTGSSDDSPATFTMPDEIGKYLQDAQDDLQSISGKPFFYTGSSDASGQGRSQFLDRDWRVCNQNVSPGTQVSVDERSISFGVVKLDEQCP